MLKMLLALHVAGGSAALLSMFVPMLTRKGGRAHRRAGWVFVGGMGTVSATALTLSAARFLFDPRPAAQRAALFLFYIAILTAAGVSTGVRVLRVHRSAKALRHTTEQEPPHDHVAQRPPAVAQRFSAARWDLGISSLLLATSVGMAAFGLITRTPLFAAFSVIGFVSGGGQLAYWLRPPAHHMHWWFEHMNSMLGSCIAATTAFLVVNAGQLGAPRGSLVVWLAPTIVGTPLIVIWTTYYRRRFAASQDAAYENRFAFSVRRGGSRAAATSEARRDISGPAPAVVHYTPSRTA